MEKIEYIFIFVVLLLIYQRAKKIVNENKIIKSSLKIEENIEQFWNWNIPTRSYNYWYDDYFIRYPWMLHKFYNPYYYPYYTYPWNYINGFPYSSQFPVKLIKREIIKKN